MLNKPTAGWAWLGCSWDEDPRREKRIRDTRYQTPENWNQKANKMGVVS